MDGIIHDDKENAGGWHRHVGMPAIKQDGNVMVPMKENERLLVYNDEERVKEFTVKETIMWGKHDNMNKVVTNHALPRLTEIC